MKSLVNRHKFKPMVKQTNPSMLRNIIHKYDKISRSPSVGIGVGPQISECIRSKGAEENESLLLKGNFFYLPKWQEV